MEIKDDGKPKKMTWRVFRPAPKPKPKASVAPQKIVLLPSTRIPSPTQNPRNAPRISTGIIHQKPASTLGSPLQPKRGPITGNPNQMERGKISGEPESGPRRTANLGPWQATISNTCITCLIVSIIVLAILFLLTLVFSIFSLVVLMYNGDFLGNWNHLTTFEPMYEDEVVEDTADRDY